MSNVMQANIVGPGGWGVCGTVRLWDGPTKNVEVDFFASTNGPKQVHKQVGGPVKSPNLCEALNQAIKKLGGECYSSHSVKFNSDIKPRNHPQKQIKSFNLDGLRYRVVWP